ncbi:hypothetical protein Tco_0022327 [Tanacetum coccineum]
MANPIADFAAATVGIENFCENKGKTCDFGRSKCILVFRKSCENSTKVVCLKASLVARIVAILNKGTNSTAIVPRTRKVITKMANPIADSAAATVGTIEAND